MNHDERATLPLASVTPGARLAADVRGGDRDGASGPAQTLLSTVLERRLEDLR